MSQIADNLCKEIYESKEIDNNDLVQICELCGSLLNLKTISKYAKDNNKSYNGVKKFRQVVKIFDVKFIIDNL